MPNLGVKLHVDVVRPEKTTQQKVFSLFPLNNNNNKGFGYLANERTIFNLCFQTAGRLCSATQGRLDGKAAMMKLINGTIAF
jgi:hypothetical protein